MTSGEGAEINTSTEAPIDAEDILDLSDDEGEDPLSVSSASPPDDDFPADVCQQLLEFTIDSDIDITSSSLADMIADSPGGTENNPGTQKEAAPDTSKHVYTVDDAFADWV